MTTQTQNLPLELPFWRVLQPKIATLAQTALRLALAVPFFKSGLTKWDGFLQLSDGAETLFSDEFKLHLFGMEYPYPAPHVMAFASGCMEILLPILLVLGLGTRLAAFGLLGMTAIIQLTVPDGWANFHLIWAASALALIAYGPGPISLDALLGRLRSKKRD
ncbi:DoxX family protein [Rhodoblastus sp.]|uniref:DoxX family protein n=1 Tax=Rhodoblastus sp. TaxID=1962975 RepID=UPI003F9C3035